MLTILLCLTLVVGNGSPFTAARECRQIDEVPDLRCEDVQARLDAYSASLYDEPDSRGYIIFYEGKYWEGRAPRRGEAFAEVAGYKDYLVRYRNIQPERIVLLNGGYRENITAQFYICPRGAALPQVSPTLEARDVKFRRGRISRERYEWCCGCL